MWNKAENEFIEEQTKHLVYSWARDHVAAKAAGASFQVPNDVSITPYREYAVFRKWISSEGFVLSGGMKVAASLARR